jgi:dipeptidyl aminopeptidase/acylaminoacyl peptidase
MKKAACILFIIIFVLPVFSEDGIKKITMQELLKRTSIYSPEFSPDGKWIAHVRGEKETWDGRRNSDIWLISSDGSEIRRLTGSEKSDWGPQWSPDGSKIAFFSTRSGKRQVHLIHTDGGEAVTVTDEGKGVNSFRWIGNSKIAFVTSELKDSSLAAAEENAGGGYVVGTQFGKSALWVQSVNDPSDKKKITDGSFYIGSMCPSSDGKMFVLVTADDSDYYKQIVHSRIVLIDDEGKELYAFDGAKDMGRVGFSPDDRYISFSGSTVGFSSGNALFVVDIAKKAIKNLTEAFDPTISSIRWIDDKTLAFLTLRKAYTGLYSIPAAGGDIRPILEPYYVFFSYTIHPKTKRIAFIGTRGFMPTTMFITRWGGKPSDARALMCPDEWMEERSLAGSRVIAYPSFDGQTIEAVLTLPPDYDADKIYPLLVLPHGGPDGMSLNDFGLFGQVFAQEGLMILEPNFRGGIGYGSEFYKANRGRIGDIDYKDIMAGVDYLIREDMVDSTRMVVGGWSFGGTMTGWIISHNNRFKAAVVVAGVCDYYSRYGQGDINHSDVARWEFMGVPVLNPENYKRSSPIYFMHRCETPTLIMHGEDDVRVPVAQAWELYRALNDVGVEVEFVLYPDAGHGISAPKQFFDVMTRWVDWYHRHLSE